MLYKDWLEEWLNTYIRVTAKSKTVSRYAEIINNHISPYVGKVDLLNLSSIELQHLVKELLISGNRITGKGLSSSAVNSVITVIQTSLNVAQRLGLIDSNPSNNLVRPKLIEKHIECFNLEEQKRIEHAVLTDKHPYMLGIIVCLYTGLRIGELLALTWQDIDFSNEILSVTKTCYDGKNNVGNFGRIVYAPKTQSSRRVIPLSKQVIKILKNMKKQSDSDLVITKKSKPLSVRTYQRNFATLLEKLHIEYRGFHALRHTFATRAIECGMDVKTLSEILGHKNSTITLNRYAHSLMEHKRDMMNLLGKLL